MLVKKVLILLQHLRSMRTSNKVSNQLITTRLKKGKVIVHKFLIKKEIQLHQSKIKEIKIQVMITVGLNLKEKNKK